MLNIGSDTKRSNEFELVVQVRNNKGEPTGRTKSFIASSGAEMEQLWNKNSFRAKKKKKKAEAINDPKQIEKALKEAESHTNKIRTERNLEE